MKKPKKKPFAPTLHRCVLVPVTDPNEIAELDRRFRAATKAGDTERSRTRKVKASGK
jgi:hypothetical protein